MASFWVHDDQNFTTSSLLNSVLLKSTQFFFKPPDFIFIFWFIGFQKNCKTMVFWISQFFNSSALQNNIKVGRKTFSCTISSRILHSSKISKNAIFVWSPSSIRLTFLTLTVTTFVHQFLNQQIPHSTRFFGFFSCIGNLIGRNWKNSNNFDFFRSKPNVYQNYGADAFDQSVNQKISICWKLSDYDYTKCDPCIWRLIMKLPENAKREYFSRIKQFYYFKTSCCISLIKCQNKTF